MAITFDESDDYYSIADATNLTLPDGDWCLGIWIYQTENAGDYFRYLFSNNTYAANNSCNLFTRESGRVSLPDRYEFNVEDGDGTNVEAQGATALAGDSTWRLIICQRDTNANEVQLWLCTRGGTATKDASGADTNLGAIDGGVWNIGRRTDGDSDRYFGGELAEFFKGNFALTQAEIEAAAVASILCLNKDLDIYYPLFRADATLKNWCAANDATRQSVPTTSAHPPLFRPGPPQSP